MTQTAEKRELTEEELEARRRYHREYRKAHPDRVRQWQRNYWRRLAEKQAGTPPVKE